MFVEKEFKEMEEIGFCFSCYFDKNWSGIKLPAILIRIYFIWLSDRTLIIIQT